MKKLVLFALCASLFIACTSDDSGFSTEGSRLRKVVLDFSGQQSETVILHYNGNKQVKQVTSSSSSQYFFNGNLIVKMGFGNNFQFLEYDSQDRLTQMHYSSQGDEYVTDVTYNPDGTVDCQDKINGELKETRRLYFAEGEVVQKDVTRRNSDTNQWESSVFHFTYDDKNVPDQGVGRWIFNYLSTFGSGTYPNHHNLLTIHQEFNGEEATYGYEYIYNSQNYPIKMTQMNNSWQSTGRVSNYFYQ